MMRRWMPILSPLRLLAVLAFVMLAGQSSALAASLTREDVSRILTSDPALLRLTDSGSSVSLEGHLYHRPDPGKGLGYNDVVSAYLEGLRGAPTGLRTLNLGGTATPNWLLIPVSNESSRDDWLLDFGSLLNGRFGVAQDFYVFEHLSRQTIVRGFTHLPAGTQQRGAPSSVFPLKIKPGAKALVVVYFVPLDNMPTVISPRIVSAADHLSAVSSSLSPAFIGKASLFALAFVFVLFGLFSRMFTPVVLSAYFGVLLAQVAFFDQSVFSTEPWFAQGMALSQLGLGLLALVTTRMCLNTGHYSLIDDHLSLGLVLTLVLCGVFSLLILPESSLISNVAIFVPVLACILASAGLSVVMGQFEKRPDFILFAFGWFVGAAAYSVTYVAPLLMEAIPAFLPGIGVAGVVLQGVLMLAAGFQKWKLIERDRMTVRGMSRDREESPAVAKIREARDGGAQARLLKVVEQERASLAELKAREAERTEEMRKSKEAADEANRAKSAFLAVVSHEIRTPMTGVMGIVRLLMDGKLSREQHDYVMTLQESGESMMSLLNDILDYEKIESGKMVLERIDFDLHRLISGAVTLMSGHAAERGITLTASVAPDVPHYVIGDPTRLRQVVLNLVGNAIKFTSRGGVSITVKRIEKDETTQLLGRGGFHQVYFAVKDTGIGIPVSAQRTLFNPFAQADASISRKYGGTGLGLAICKRLIEVMGSTIHMNSKEGEGTTFFFTLMMEEGSAEAVVEAPVADDVGSEISGTFSVLTVEDNLVNQKVLKGFLEKGGHRVTAAMNGEDALNALRQDAFDLVLMDIEMPGISGYETARQIRAMANSRVAATPIVALTGNTGDEDVRACREVGMNDVIFKPISPERLDEVLHILAQGGYDAPGTASGAASSSASVSETVPVVAPSVEPAADGVEVIVDDGDHLVPVEEDSFAESIGMSSLPMDQAGSEGVAETAPLEDEVFDREIMGALRRNLPPDQLQDLISSLLSKSEEIIEALRGVAIDDFATAGTRAHELKGMAANFGLKELARLASQIEGLAKAHATGEIFALVAELPMALERAKASIQRWMEA